MAQELRLTQQCPAGRTSRTAQAALDDIKKWRLPATPLFFEFCFAYESGENPSLTDAVRDVLRNHGTLDISSVNALYARFISATEVGHRINSVGLSLYHEISEISQAIGTAVQAANTCSSDINGAQNALAGIAKPIELKSFATKLAQSILNFRMMNLELENKLTSSRGEIDNLRQNLKTILREAQTDALTGLSNRKTLDLMMAKHFGIFQETNDPLSFMMCDIDHFRRFNNDWGHPVGDQVLRLVGRALRASFKGKDVVARYGGEEFAIVLPETRLDAACVIAEQVRRTIMANPVRNRATGVEMGRVTFSIGVAEAVRSDSMESLIARADECLYQAKNNGRNRVISSRELATESGSAPRIEIDLLANTAA